MYLVCVDVVLTVFSGTELCQNSDVAGLVLLLINVIALL